MSSDAAGILLPARVPGPAGAPRVMAVPPRAPGPGEVRIDVTATGICAADGAAVAARAPAARFPVTPGHEVADMIAVVGAQVSGWQRGERVAVGWFGDSCGHCTACRSCDVVHCLDRRVPGLSYPGGWAATFTVPAAVLGRIPGELPAAEAAPFGCAGSPPSAHCGTAARSPATGSPWSASVGWAVSRRSSPRRWAVRPSPSAAASGSGRRPWIRALTTALTPSPRNQAWRCASSGGARLIVSTAVGGDVLAGLVQGLTPHGRPTVAGFDATAVRLPMADLVMHSRSITGHLTGSATAIEQAVRCTVTTRVRPRVRTLPLQRTGQGLKAQQAGDARFRIVLTTPTA